ncbi:MAG: DUF4268 domain-containing protein [Methanosarcinales archaeon]|nr:DUF4268 domain-containing protein [Methanosarcinales archaeon]
MIELGRMEKISELRDVWKSEDGDFTPWLARDDNLALLADAIGINLELEAQEQSVGPFRADILCKDTETNNWVLIENQIEKTDHTHLGQILTYGAGLEATTIVWIAKSFTEEHRATLDWLNEITSDKFNFFGLEIELWRIGDSPIAPKFNVVSKPNEWVRDGGEIQIISPEGKLRLDYWTTFIDYLHERNSTIKTSKPHSWHYLPFSIGRANVGLSAIVYTHKRKIAIQLYFAGPNAKSYFEQIQQDKEAIEKEIGTKLVWDIRPTTRAVYLFRDDEDIKNTESWPEQHKWLYENLEAFYKVFAERAKNLSTDYQSEDTEEAPNETAESVS